MEISNRNPELWQKAKARTKFQAQLVTYVLVNCSLWILWAVTGRPDNGGIPWPIWPTVFWGIGVVAGGLAAYGDFGQPQRTQREYERLVRAQGPDSLDRYR